MNYMLLMIGGLMLFSLLLFFNFWGHSLMYLLSLEFVVLVVLMSMFFILYQIKGFYILIFMVFFAIESVVGLSLLVQMVPSKDSSLMKNLNLIMW